MRSGFFIKELRLTGDGVNPASVIFKKGLNVITGPSDTGKSYIFECIDYMLGGSTCPKNIIEVRNRYSSIYLEIEDFEENHYTLERSFKASDARLYNCILSEIEYNESTILAKSHNANNENTISGFLLKLCNLSKKKVRKNIKGETVSLTYRLLSKFLMVGEERIITNKSLIANDKYTPKTTELNVLRCLLSGKDDSEIIVSLSKDEITHKKGRLALLEELLIEANKEFIDMTSPETSGKSVKIINRDITIITKEYKNLNDEFIKLEFDLNLLKNRWNEKIVSRDSILRLLKRSDLLDKQYVSDISRLRSSIEAGLLLLNNKDIETKCPVCKSIVLNLNYDEEMKSLIRSSNLEILKINKLRYELLMSKTAMKAEDYELSNKIDVLHSEIQKAEKKLKDGLGKSIDVKVQGLNKLNNIKSMLVEIENKNIQIDKFEKQRNRLSDIISSSNKKVDFPKLSTSLMSELSNSLKNILIECDYKNVTNVVFNDQNNDFSISEEERNLSGKGYRAITYLAFMIALQEQFKDKDYKMGVPIVDSPFVTYKKISEKDEDHIPIDLAENFYRYLAKSSTSEQFIIIENVEPPEEIIEDINHIKFTKSPIYGRYGFVPVEN